MLAYTYNRIYFGKNKVMQFALGREPSEEERTDLHILSKEIVGNNRGLLFTNRTKDEVSAVFKVNTIVVIEKDYYFSSLCSTSKI